MSPLYARRLFLLHYNAVIVIAIMRMLTGFYLYAVNAQAVRFNHAVAQSKTGLFCQLLQRFFDAVGRALGHLPAAIADKQR